MCNALHFLPILRLSSPNVFISVATPIKKKKYIYNPGNRVKAAELHSEQIDHTMNQRPTNSTVPEK